MFEVDEDQKAKIKAWSEAQDEIVRAKQVNSKDPMIRQLAKMGSAYYGACGGELTYCFTPTSLGMILVVQHSGTKAEMNVTDFDSW